MIEQIQPKLDRIAKADADKRRKKVAILGAGMAGLISSYELCKLGHEVTIYEASNRIGGRAWTHRFDDGQYHELGAMRFPKEHDHTRHYATLCNLEFRTFINHHDEADSYYFLKGHILKKMSWFKDLLPYYDLTEKDKKFIFGDSDRSEVKHNQLLGLFDALGQITKEINKNKADKYALLGIGPMTENIRKLDAISFGEYLRSQLSSQAIELLGGITGLEVWWNKALTMFLREDIAAEERRHDQGLKKGPLDEIIGGTDLLPSGMLQLLRNANVNIQTGTKVTGISNNAKCIIVHLEQGSNVEFIECDHVICTLPYSILRNMFLEGFSDGKMSAIRNLNYASSAKVLLNTKSRFWEKEPYNIKGGGSQMDLINRQIYYPSNNVDAEVKNSSKSFGNPMLRSQYFKSYALRNKEDEMPGVMVGSYVWGQDARRIGALTHEERERVIKECVSNIHPEIMEEGMVKDSASISWDEFQFTKGAFCFMNPGDFTHYYRNTIKSEGNLHFAGEHCSLDNGWIQGAIISALAAVENLVKN
jgi:monoamine oxidase